LDPPIQFFSKLFIPADKSNKMATASQIAEKFARWALCNNGTAFSRAIKILFSDSGFSPCYLGPAPDSIFQQAVYPCR
jgi:hypothetical protein